MAALIPLLLPQIVDASVNIGIGISNALQGDSSSVSFQIGNKVFTNKKKFNFGSLPIEIREKIILMAMEESKELILPTPYFFDPTQPLTKEQLRNIQRNHPLHPESKHYRSIVGDRVSANGYPISTWRWALVNVEWRDIVRKPLWTHLEVLGYRPYTNLLKRMRSKGGLEVLKNVKEITLREGFKEPEDIYTILSNHNFTSLDTVSILPDYPTSFHQLVAPVPTFLFGLQLVRTPKPIKSLAFGLPLEQSTNSASRQHLKTLRPPRLEVTFGRPTVQIFRELSDLISESTDLLSIRYIALRSIVNHQIFLCEPLQSFKQIHLHLHLPRSRLVMTGPAGAQTLGEDPSSPIAIFTTSLISALESSDPEVQNRYKVFKVEGWETEGQVASATRTKIWPSDVLFDHDDTEEPSEHVEAKPEEAVKSTSNDHWERETNLKLFGGFLNLSLESKRHR